MKQPENRLAPEEIAYRRAGNSPETIAWNRHFEMLIGEYEAAIDDLDEGLIGTAVHEVRKILGDSVMGECGLRRVARRALVHRQVLHCAK